MLRRTVSREGALCTSREGRVDGPNDSGCRDLLHCRTLHTRREIGHRELWPCRGYNDGTFVARAPVEWIRRTKKRNLRSLKRRSDMHGSGIDTHDDGGMSDERCEREQFGGADDCGTRNADRGLNFFSMGAFEIIRPPGDDDPEMVFLHQVPGEFGPTFGEPEFLRSCCPGMKNGVGFGFGCPLRYLQPRSSVCVLDWRTPRHQVEIMIYRVPLAHAGLDESIVRQ